MGINDMVRKSIITVLLVAVILVAGVKTSLVNAAEKSSVVSNSGFLSEAESVYQDLKINPAVSVPSWEAFSTAVKGFYNLKSSGKVKKNILSVVDFSLPSTEKRFWIIDLDTKEVLINDYVAHGRNSGNNVANKFSNIPSSYSSSLGFYITAEKYHGKHGLSLRMDGMDKGYNDNARARAIVIHGADYVSPYFIKTYGRLGRSLGCPSVSMDIHEDVINTIYGGSVLFIYSADNDFAVKSSVLNSPDKKMAMTL
ncbi:MAG: murein L,D-transpeptidase catalytic domain family protein [Prolixibacteraceae bacterium]